MLQIDEWPIYFNVGALGRYIAVAQLLQEVQSVPGHIAEFGIWRGSHLIYLAKVQELFGRYTHKLVYGFDSFQGLVNFTDKDNSERPSEGGYKISREEVEANIQRSGLSSPRIVLVCGDIEESLPTLLAKDQGVMFSFVYCDCDLYTPTRTILFELHDRMVPGALFVFDEWNYPEWPGEGAAIRELMKTYPGAYKMRQVTIAPQPSLVLQRL